MIGTGLGPPAISRSTGDILRHEMLRWTLVWEKCLVGPCDSLQFYYFNFYILWWDARNSPHRSCPQGVLSNSSVDIADTGGHDQTR
mmetsp:Transcript_52397/g.139504  ORF Transcript_52397/g.139504 Transcript_52397/m.139504 type:complete len:86 (+) Transcript_52397:323-580(+)